MHYLELIKQQNYKNFLRYLTTRDILLVTIDNKSLYIDHTI
jgi:hypothetical protein